MKKIFIIPIILLLASCSGWFINSETSEICDLSACCNPDNMWPEIYEKYKVTDTLDPKAIAILEDFKSMPFSSEVIYFKEGPEEYIGIGRGNSAVRYVYNKNLADQVLDGLSTELPESEKIRIGLRLHSLIYPYLDEEGRKESVILIRSQCEKFLEKQKDR